MMTESDNRERSADLGWKLLAYRIAAVSVVCLLILWVSWEDDIVSLYRTIGVAVCAALSFAIRKLLNLNQWWFGAVIFSLILLFLCGSCALKLRVL